VNYFIQIGLIYDTSAHLWDWRVPNIGGGSAPRAEMAFDAACKAIRKQLKKDIRGREKRLQGKLGIE
jgi:hypothetical protein